MVSPSEGSPVNGAASNIDTPQKVIASAPAGKLAVRGGLVFKNRRDLQLDLVHVVLDGFSWPVDDSVWTTQALANVERQARSLKVKSPATIEALGSLDDFDRCHGGRELLAHAAGSLAV